MRCDAVDGWHICCNGGTRIVFSDGLVFGLLLLVALLRWEYTAEWDGDCDLYTLFYILLLWWAGVVDQWAE